MAEGARLRAAETAIAVLEERLRGTDSGVFTLGFILGWLLGDHRAGNGPKIIKRARRRHDRIDQ